MFSDFSDRDFALVIKSVESYGKSCEELIKLALDKCIPVHVISSLINIQRKEYVLPIVNHRDSKDLLLDTVVSDSKYFFKSENLRLILSSLIHTHEGGNRINYDMISKIVNEVKKLLSFKINYSYEISEYLKTLAYFK